jgi:hypothetical protein
VRSTRLRKFAAGAALATLAVLPACAFPASPPTATTPAPPFDPFTQIDVRGSHLFSCTRSKNPPGSLNPTEYVLECPLDHFFIGQDMYIFFPDKSFNAQVQATSGTVAWVEKADWENLFPENRGAVQGDAVVNLAGGSVHDQSDWVLGLESDVADVQARVKVTITKR